MKVFGSKWISPQGLFLQAAIKQKGSISTISFIMWLETVITAPKLYLFSLSPDFYDV